MNLTVIICTYNRSEMLGHCLESLCTQSCGCDAFDVLVVDNNSTDGSRAVAESFLPRLNLRYVMEPEQGLSHARNRGLHESTTDWVAFLDDDAKAVPGWVEVILETIAKNDFDAFGGPFYAWHYFGPPPVWLPEDCGNYVSEQGYGPMTGDTFIPGGNCSFKKAAALEAGAFPANMGMAGTKCAYGEETMVFFKMEQAGFRMGYVPAMRIEHCVLPYKYALKWQLLSYFMRGKASYAVQKAMGWRPGIIRTAAKCCRDCLKSMWCAVKVLFSRFSPQSRQKLVVQCTQVCFQAGIWVAAVADRIKPKR